MVEYTGREVLLKDENGEVIIPYVGIDAVLLTGDQNIGGLKTFTDGETKFLLGEVANCRFISSDKKYGVITRVDESDFYFLLTNADDPNGVWNAIRPFRINLATGVLSSEANAYVPDAYLKNSVVVTNSISKDSKGYVKMGNGIIIQWGTESAGSTVTVTLPIAFSNTNFKVIATSLATSGSLGALGINTKTTTGFNIYASGGASSVNSQWIAIGY